LLNIIPIFLVKNGKLCERWVENMWNRNEKMPN
jgi:hypothetical protein